MPADDIPIRTMSSRDTLGIIYFRTSLLCLRRIFGTIFAAKQWETIADFLPPENPSILHNGEYFICRAEMMRAEFTAGEGRPARRGAV